jgi:hypothetical protein
MIRTTERTEFLTDVVVTAIENYGYGPWFEVCAYDSTKGRAVIEVEDDKANRHMVDADMIAKGFGVIRSAVLRRAVGDDECQPDVLHNVKTGQRLYLSPSNQRRILTAYRECDAGDLDVVDALAILECALFGAVTYA